MNMLLNIIASIAEQNLPCKISNLPRQVWIGSLCAESSALRHFNVNIAFKKFVFCSFCAYKNSKVRHSRSRHVGKAIFINDILNVTHMGSHQYLCPSITEFCWQLIANYGLTNTYTFVLFR